MRAAVLIFEKSCLGGGWLVRRPVDRSCRGFADIFYSSCDKRRVTGDK
jgi:hypothetical protein